MIDYQVDRIITVLGTEGLLYFIDSNVYVEIREGRIVNGDLSRMKEVIPISYAMSGNRYTKLDKHL